MPNRREQIQEMYDKGVRDIVIAEELGVSRERVRQIRGKLKLPALKKQPRYGLRRHLCRTATGPHMFMPTRKGQLRCPEHSLPARHLQVCPSCGTECQTTTQALCRRCAQRQYRQTLYNARRARGACVDCGGEAAEGRARCAVHLAQLRGFYKKPH